MFSLAEAPVKAGSVAVDTIAGGYTMIPQKYYHANVARNALGLVGGNDVSMITGNLVDLESDLRNITRDASKAPSRQYQPSCPLGVAGKTPAPANALSAVNGGTCDAWPTSIVYKERSTGKAITVSTMPRHLPTIQLFSYPGVPAPETFTQEVYGAPWRF
jgi:hypothetical protein